MQLAPFEGAAAVTAGCDGPEPPDDPEAAARVAGLALAAAFESARTLHMDTAGMVARVDARLIAARHMMAELGIPVPRTPEPPDCPTCQEVRQPTT